MEDLSFYNAEDTQLRKMQIKMVDILNTVVAIFERNKIPYWLDGGTLLGAVRHGGFIPWDDDIDIDVPTSHYLRAIEVLKKELPKDMVCQKQGWIKVRDCFSVMEEPGTENLEYRGIFIDIFEAKSIGTKEHKLKSKIDIAIRKFRRQGRSNCRRIMKLIYHLSGLFFIFEKKTLFMTDDLFVRWAFPLSLLSPLGKVSFEGREYNAPNDVDKYLKIHYGDYMRIPKVEDRVVHSTNVVFLSNKIIHE
ncbi:MAG: LicD family protein [Rikenellaceae bacterium]